MRPPIVVEYQPLHNLVLRQPPRDEAHSGEALDLQLPE